MIVVSFVDFGIHNWTVREMVRTNGSVETYSRTLGVKIVLGGVLATLWLGVVGGVSISSSRATTYLPFGIYIFFAVAASILAVPGAGSDAHGLGELGSVYVEMEDFGTASDFLANLRGARIVIGRPKFLLMAEARLKHEIRRP